MTTVETVDGRVETIGADPRAAWTAAYVAAQSEMPTITKDGKANAGQYSYTYASLPSIVDAIRPVLTKHGLAVAQSVISTDRGPGVVTRIIHEAGHIEEFGPTAMPAGNTAQAMGSAISYGRRYALLAALGLAAEDDDGEKASGGGEDRGRMGKASPTSPPPVERPEAGAGASVEAPSRSETGQSPASGRKHEHRPNYDVGPNAAGRVPCAEPGCRAWVKLEEEVAS